MIPVLHADFGDLSYFSCTRSKHGVLLSTSHPDPSTRPPPPSTHPHATHPHATHPHPSPPLRILSSRCTEAGLEELRGLLLRQTWILWPEDSVELQQRRGGGLAGQEIQGLPAQRAQVDVSVFRRPSQGFPFGSPFFTNQKSTLRKKKANLWSQGFPKWLTHSVRVVPETKKKQPILGVRLFV